MRSQCPVSTHIHTIIKDRKKDKISAAVNRPHTPNDILQSTKQHSLLSEQIKFVTGASVVARVYFKTHNDKFIQ